MTKVFSATRTVVYEHYRVLYLKSSTSPVLGLKVESSFTTHATVLSP